MSNTELKILFPTEKLDALRFFMDKKDLTIEKELKDTLDKTYEKIVPAHVRDYVESKIEQAPEPEEQAQQTESRRQSRTTSRRQRQTVAEAPAAPETTVESGTPTEQENQGMTLSM